MISVQCASDRLTINTLEEMILALKDWAVDPDELLCAAYRSPNGCPVFALFPMDSET